MTEKCAPMTTIATPADAEDFQEIRSEMARRLIQFGPVMIDGVEYKLTPTSRPSHARDEASRACRRRQRNDSLLFVAILLCNVAVVAGIGWAILNFVGS